MASMRAHFERAGVARQKWPEDLRAVEELPRTPSGKVKKFVLRDQIRHEARSSAPPTGASPTSA